MGGKIIKTTAKVNTTLKAAKVEETQLKKMTRGQKNHLNMGS